MMAPYDDPRVGDQQLLERIHDLHYRRMLARSSDEQKARLAEAGSRPESWAPLTAEEHLELLQRQRWLELRMSRRHADVHAARRAGAGWDQIADVLGLDAATVRDEHAGFVDGQQRLHDSTGRFGMTDDEAAAAWALLEDDVPAVPR